jgi:energy-coupling factor transport system ATP-binding protein
MQRVAIASILVMQPPVLVLDEPTSQLDPIGSKDVFSTIRRLVSASRTTVVMIEHKLEWLAAFSDRMIILSEGSLVADGHPEDVLTEEAVWRKGIGQTRYTQAARSLRDQGIWPEERSLPVSLESAVAGFNKTLKLK